MLVDKLNGGQSAFCLNHIKSAPLKTSRQNGAIIADVVYYQQSGTDTRVTAGHIGLVDFGLQHCNARCWSVRYRHQFIFQTENTFASWGAVPEKPSSALCCSRIHASTRIEKHDPCPSSLVAEIPEQATHIRLGNTDSGILHLNFDPVPVLAFPALNG